MLTAGRLSSVFIRRSFSNQKVVGLIGLGEMGSKLLRNLKDDGNSVVIHDINMQTAMKLQQDGKVH
jgi:6-phosphogluconate dehydrogenase (decarboxylating)